MQKIMACLTPLLIHLAHDVQTFKAKKAIDPRKATIGPINLYEECHNLDFGTFLKQGLSENFIFVIPEAFPLKVIVRPYYVDLSHLGTQELVHYFLTLKNGEEKLLKKFKKLTPSIITLENVREAIKRNPEYKNKLIKNHHDYISPRTQVFAAGEFKIESRILNANGQSGRFTPDQKQVERLLKTPEISTTYGSLNYTLVFRYHSFDITQGPPTC